MDVFSDTHHVVVAVHGLSASDMTLDGRSSCFVGLQATG
jgi:hypothetical protein